MKLLIKRALTTTFTDKYTGITYEIRTTKLKYEPNFLFEKRHTLKVKVKKWRIR